MRLPAALCKGLSEEDVKVIEGQLKSGVLPKQLRKELENEISRSYIDEEASSKSIEEIYQAIGRRSGLRYALNLLPEDSK